MVLRPREADLKPLFLYYTRALSLVAGVWSLAGCGGGASGPPVTPKSISATAGDNQLACFGDSPAESLEVTVTGSNDRALAGAQVAWRVTQGDATVSPTIHASNASGRSRARLRLGFALTAVTVEATLPGLPPVTFSAGATVAAHVLGDQVAGALAATDCDFGDGSFIDYYDVGVLGQQSFTVALDGAPSGPPGFDTFLWLYDSTGLPAALNDDAASADSLTSSFFQIIAAGGRYVVGANTFSPEVTGSYGLQSDAIPVAADSCAEVWVTPGITTDQQVAATDCSLTPGPYYADFYRVVLAVGQTITVTETSGALDAYLELYREADPIATLVASDDNGGGATNARLSYTSPVLAAYVIGAETADTAETGAYTLTIAAAGSPVAVGASSPRADRLPRVAGALKSRRATGRLRHPVGW
jgi:hypothetical protein